VIWLLSTALAGTMSVDELTAYALDHSPQTERSTASVDASEGGNTQAWSSYMPQLRASIGYDAFVPFSGANVQGLGTITAQLDQLIYDFGAATGRIRAAKQQRNAVTHQDDSVRLDVVHRTELAAYSALSRRFRIDVAKKAEEAYQLQLDQARSGYEQGTRERIDVTNAEVNLAQSTFDVVDAQAKYDDAISTLREVIGGYDEATLEVQWPSGEVADLPSTLSPPPGNLDPLVDQALSVRPELDASAARISSMQGQVSLARSGWLPSLSARASIDYYTNNIWPIPNNFRAGARLNWNVFPGMQAQGAIREAKGQKAIAEAEHRATQLSITSDVTSAWLNATAKWKQVGVATSLLALASENLDLATARYENGVSDLVEYNDAIVKKLDAEDTLVNAVFGYLSAAATLERAVASGDSL